MGTPVEPLRMHIPLSQRDRHPRPQRHARTARQTPNPPLRPVLISIFLAIAALASAPAKTSWASGQSDTNHPQEKQTSAQTSAPLPAWPAPTPEDHARAMRESKALAEQARAAVGNTMRELETQYFLFSTDLPQDEAMMWAGLLDRMYARLSDLFGVEKGANIWLGKATVFVFSKPGDYYAFESAVFESDPAGTAGRCHNRSDGMVVIAFYRQKQDMDFATLLVHESVHGFLHRYRSPIHIPSWANEGLADTIAAELVPKSSWVPNEQKRAKTQLRQRGNLGGDFFTTEHIDAWQYGVASSLCSFMIRENKKGYVAFINGIKDGLGWEESLRKNYNTDAPTLVSAFGRSIGIKALTP